MPARPAYSTEYINQLLAQLAVAADLANTWARELGVEECDNPYRQLALLDLIDRLWLKTSMKRENIHDNATNVR